MDLGHMNVVVKCMYLYVGSGSRNWNGSRTAMVFFLFLVCNTTTQLATQLPQRRIQVVRSNMVAQKHLTESNGTPAMDPGPMNFILTYKYVLK